ncbi:flagellar protein FlaG [Desulfonatronum sp. SC1]|uniref:flagellar protein FlaG n=1 Tax=Desulfonatronum sp. SC1 TaxID=2109626 RepID=UPI000D31FA22|nr:flagellar protein FlaG [Desulfonatronum sp. SC1]PTN38651.1 hypothetical protein C6366_01550 [Desulfonatronum sp. SC1]
MRVDNNFETRSYVSGDLGVAYVLNVPESDKLGALSHDRDRDGHKGDDARQKGRSALMEAMDVAEEHLKGTGLNIRLKVADKSERLQVEVFDPKTKEVLRRFPPDEIIRLAESIDEMAGLIVDRSL